MFQAPFENLTDYRMAFGTCQSVSKYHVTLLSISTTPTHQPEWRIPVIEVGVKKPDKEIALCSKSMYNYKTSDIPSLIEFIEFYIMMGVQKFFFYDTYDCDVTIRNLMEYYSRKGLVEMRPWQLPMPSLLQSNNLYTSSKVAFDSVLASSRSHENPHSTIREVPEFTS